MQIGPETDVVLFDLDGTLVDHDAAARAGAVHLAAELGLPSPQEQWRRWAEIERRWFLEFERGNVTHIGQRIKRCREFLGDDQLNDAAALQIYDVYVEAYRAAWRTYPDAGDALRRAAASGREVGIFTNGATEMQARKLSATGLHFDGLRLLAATDLGAAKPDPRAYAAAEARLGAAGPGSVALIGDDWHNDVAGARAAGWRAVYLVREGVEAHPVMPRAETPVASLDQIVF